MINLQELREATDDIVEAILAMPQSDRPYGAINWADLSCVEAYYKVDDEGVESYGVVIEEAAPDDRELCALIYAKLCARGYEGVTVETEW